HIRSGGTRRLLFRRRDVRGGGSGEKTGGFLANDRLAAGHFHVALLQVIVRDRLEVIDVVEENVLHEVDFGLDVARHGNVDQEQRPATPRGQERFQAAAVDYVMRGRGAADQYVHARELS